MKVLLTSHGSTGDIYPVISLGHALIKAGHQVRFATVSLFREEVESAGIDFVNLPPNWNQADFARVMRDLTKAKNGLDTLRIIYSETVPYFDEIIDILRRELEAADIFVSNYIFSHLCVLAREVGVPSAVTTFAHNIVPSENYPPISLPRFLAVPEFFRRFWNRALWNLTDKVICWQINRVVGEVLQRNGIRRLASFALEPADKILVSVSPGLFGRENLWSERFKFSGYLRWQSPEDLSIKAQLDAFCLGEQVPILTFGSVAFDNANDVMARFMRHWPREKKIIIQSGWAGLTIEHPHSKVCLVPRVSHEQLFKYASMVIHHGGAGTTASVLHAGAPNIVIPQIGDQWFFASEIKRIGVGLEVKRRTWPEDLPKAVSAVEKAKSMRLRATKIAELLSREDGPSSAVRILESLLNQKI